MDENSFPPHTNEYYLHQFFAEGERLRTDLSGENDPYEQGYGNGRYHGLWSIGGEEEDPLFSLEQSQDPMYHEEESLFIPETSENPMPGDSDSGFVSPDSFQESHLGYQSFSPLEQFPFSQPAIYDEPQSQSPRHFQSFSAQQEPPRYGYPQTQCLDEAEQFSSQQFSGYQNQLGQSLTQLQQYSSQQPENYERQLSGWSSQNQPSTLHEDLILSGVSNDTTALDNLPGASLQSTFLPLQIPDSYDLSLCRSTGSSELQIPVVLRYDSSNHQNSMGFHPDPSTTWGNFYENPHLHNPVAYVNALLSGTDLRLDVQLGAAPQNFIQPPFPTVQGVRPAAELRWMPGDVPLRLLVPPERRTFTYSGPPQTQHDIPFSIVLPKVRKSPAVRPDSRYTCPKCARQFGSNTAIQHHFDLIHRAGAGKWFCPYPRCRNNQGKGWETPSRIPDHISNYHEEGSAQLQPYQG